MKTFIYDIADLETGEIVKKDCISTLEDEWSVEDVELFCGGILGKAINVVEINCEELLKMIISSTEEALQDYRYVKETYCREDRDKVVNWRLGRFGSLDALYSKIRGL